MYYLEKVSFGFGEAGTYGGILQIRLLIYFPTTMQLIFYTEYTVFSNCKLNLVTVCTLKDTH